MKNSWESCLLFQFHILYFLNPLSFKKPITINGDFRLFIAIENSENHCTISFLRKAAGKKKS